MKTIEERIAEARDELAVVELMLARQSPNLTISDACHRVIVRAQRRLADLEAVRDKRAVEVYATVSADESAQWIAHGVDDAEETSAHVLRECAHSTALDRLTILRGIAYLPVATTDEAEAESEEG